MKTDKLKNKLVSIAHLSDEQKRREILEESRVLLDLPPPKPEVLLSMGGTEMFTCGDISTVVSKAGHGKTTLLSLLVGQMISPKDEFFITQLSEEDKIVYFDTEQSDYDVWRVISRISKVTGLDAKNLHDKVQVYKTEHIGDSSRKDFIIGTIKDVKPKFVIIDGLTDLISSINDEEIAKRTISEIRAIANDLKCHILSVVHANESSTTDEPRGWIGKEGVRKSEGIIHVKFDNKEFKVKCLKGRHGRFQEWTFELDQTTAVPYFTGIKERSEVEMGRDASKDAIKDSETRDDIAKELSERSEVINACREGITAGALSEILQTKPGVGKGKANSLIKLMVEDAKIFYRDKDRGGRIYLVNQNQASVFEEDDLDLPF